MRKKIFLLVLLNFLLFFKIDFAFADTNVQSFAGFGNYYLTSGNTFSSGSGSWVQWTAGGFFGYRFTLVDSTGKKIPGTRSVDYTYSPDNKIISTNGQFYYNSLLYKTINGNVYKYRFSNRDGYGSNYINSDVNADGYLMYGFNQIKTSQNMQTALMGVSDFMDKYLVNYSSNRIFCPSSWGADTECNESNKADFISLFLHHSKFFDNSVSNIADYQKNHSVEYNNGLLKYYLAIEPLFGLGNVCLSDGCRNVYGTGFELIEVMNTDSSMGIKIRYDIAYERPHFACAFYTLPSFEKNGFEMFGKSDSRQTYYNDSCECLKSSLVTPWAGHGYTIAGCNITKLQGYGNAKADLGMFMAEEKNISAGVALFSLSDVLKLSTDSSVLNICNGNSVSFGFTETPDLSKEDSGYFDVSPLPTGGNLKCYDTVRFSYSNLLQDLLQNRNVNTSFKVSPIIATGGRTCNGKLDVDIKKQIIDNYDKIIKLKIYGKTYEFSLNTDEIQYNSFTNGYSFSLQYNYSKSIDLSYDLIKSNGIKLNADNEGFIDFSNFGASNKYITALINSNNDNCVKLDPETGEKVVDPITGKEVYASTNYNSDTKCVRDSSGYVHGLNVSGEKTGICPFKYSVEGEDGEDKFFKFREIALDNPFPARDGMVRLPGMNWLNTTNYVYDYITNNRGIIFDTIQGCKASGGKDCDNIDVSPEDIYSMEPMYSITLTPTVMKKIREYNSEHSYYSMYEVDSEYKTKYEDLRAADNSAYKLNCNSNGRECYSNFLREYIDDADFSGTCVDLKDVKGEGDLRSKLNTVVVPNYDTDFSASILLTIYNLSLGDADKDTDEEFVTYNSEWDLNKNGKIDKYGYMLSIEKYRNKNTAFYTCANKTFFSGGPLEGDE